MTRKVQVWFRQDQAECIVACLDYFSSQFATQVADGTKYKIERFAATLARGRVDEIAALVNEAIAKVQP